MRKHALMALLLLSACEKHEFHPPDRAEKVAAADTLYTRTRFDTITWPNDAAKLQAGNEVYARKCDVCHGPLGEGGTAYAQERKLEVPNLAESKLPQDSVRHRVFVGHVRGMPTWAMSDLTVREIDAVSAYVTLQLRTDSLRTNAE